MKKALAAVPPGLPDPHKRLAIYSRVSTEMQAKGLESQQRALHEYLHYKNVTDHLEFEDEDVTGDLTKKRKRPGFDALMRAVRAGEVHTVLVYSYGRFARSTLDLLQTLEEFNKLGVAFVSISEAVDTTTPTGRLVFIILAGLAQFERELTAERVRNGLKNARAKGKILGCPLGGGKGKPKRPDARILKLWDRGMTKPDDIAKELKLSRGMVYRALRSAGRIETHPRGPRAALEA